MKWQTSAGSWSFIHRNAVAPESGTNASITEQGYQAVAKKKSDAEMKIFMLRIIASQNRVLKNEGDLDGFVPWYSGTRNKQSLKRLKLELLSAPFIGWKSGHEPMSLTSMVAGAVGTAAGTLFQSFDRAAHSIEYADTNAVLLQQSKPWGNISAADTRNNTLTVTKSAHASNRSSGVAAMVASAAASHAKAKSKANRKTKHGESPQRHHKSRQRRANHGARLLHKAKHMAKHSHADRKRAARIAAHSALNEQGYKTVLATNISGVVEIFAKRAVKEAGLSVKDTRSFRKMLRYYNGDCGTGSFAALRAEIHSGATGGACSSAWARSSPYRSIAEKDDDRIAEEWVGMADRIPTWRWRRVGVTASSFLQVDATSAYMAASQGKAGATGFFESLLGRKATEETTLGSRAKLSAEGYNEVAATQNATEMATFVRRAAAEEGLRVSDEDSLRYLIRFYDGECDTQSYPVLLQELRRGGTSLRTSCGGAWLVPLS
jgi:hypothetical protein